MVQEKTNFSGVIVSILSIAFLAISLKFFYDIYWFLTGYLPLDDWLKTERERFWNTGWLEYRAKRTARARVSLALIGSIFTSYFATFLFMAIQIIVIDGWASLFSKNRKKRDLQRFTPPPSPLSRD